MILNENLFEVYEDEELDWVEVDSKQVPDSDGFMTDYTWYTNGKKHIFMFGDKDLYEPDESYSDWEVEIYPGNEQNAMDEAQEWFDNYHGFEEDEESLNESTVVEDEDDVANIVNYLFGNKPLPKHINEEDVEKFNENQAADYVYYREWENDNRIVPEAIKKLENAYNEMMGEDEELEEALPAIVGAAITSAAAGAGARLVDKILGEDFSPSLPKWLINYLNSNKEIKRKLSNRHFDLANMQYVKVPKDEMPTSGFHPLFKDETKQFIYLLRDNKRNVVYLPGINDEDIALFIDPYDDYKSTPISYISKKKLLDCAVQLGYIEMSKEINRNTPKQMERKDAVKGSVRRGQGQYYSTSGYNTGWVVPRGQDKSGYPVDKDKYKNLLDQADMETYSKQYVRYTKKLDTLRSAIIEYMSNMPLDKSISGGWGSGIQYAIRYFEDAIYSFENLQKSIERILTNENLTNEEKNQYIQEEFDGTKAFNSVIDLRKNIEKSWEELNNLKDKALKSIEESFENSNNDDEDPMAKLAKKHNLDILTPMNVEPGSMRVSGTVRDLDNFYKEAEATGLLKLEESFIVKDFYELNEIGNKLGLTSASEVDEFKKIANEIGLENEDLNTFIRDEISENENGLDAIKRYRQELIDSGVDLSILKNESLTEGAMSELDLDIQNGATFSSILKDELVPLKKKLIQLEDAEIKDVEEIEKVKKEISKIEAKLLVISKK